MHLFEEKNAITFQHMACITQMCDTNNEWAWTIDWTVEVDRLDDRGLQLEVADLDESS